MFAILSRLSILFINYRLRDLDNTKILLYKFFVQYMIQDGCQSCMCKRGIN